MCLLNTVLCARALEKKDEQARAHQPSQSTLSYKTKERRIALDSQPYTKAEFRKYYKSYKE
jgi:hypothetical protein